MPKSFLTIAVLCAITGTSASAWDRGDVAYLCYKNAASNKWMWVVGRDYEACRIRLLETPSGSRSFQAQREEYCASAGWNDNSRGDVVWVQDTGRLYSSKSSCEN